MKTNLLPIYTATAIEKAPIAGGSTYPCLMSVDIGNGKRKDYVVKILKQRTFQQYFPIHSEVIASVLAKEFDLITPNIALIRVTENFIQKLCEQPPYLNFKHELKAGIYFGSEYITGGNDATLELFDKWKDKEELKTIFAFDMFIQNVDRRQEKPNLFIKNEEIYLIDHELSLNITKLGLSLNHLSSYSGQNHLFYAFLRKKKNKNGINFDVFQEYLTRLNPNVIDTYIEQLNDVLQEKNGYPTHDLVYDATTLKKHLRQAKANPTHFIQQLLLIL